VPQGIATPEKEQKNKKIESSASLNHIPNVEVHHDRLRSLLERGEFDKIPLELVSERKYIEDFQSKSRYKLTPLLLAIVHGQLSQVPKELLTKELLLDCDQEGNTGLHLACQEYALEYIPKKLLKKEYLLKKNKMGETVYHAAANYGEFDKIPESEISDQILLKKCQSGKRVIRLLFYPEIRRDIPDFDQSRPVLKKLKDQTLKMLYKECLQSKNPDIQEEFEYINLKKELRKRSKEIIKKSVKRLETKDGYTFDL